jgi:hypothetical protein
LNGRKGGAKRLESPWALGFCSRPADPLAWSEGSPIPRGSEGVKRLLSSRNGFAVSNDYPRLAAVLASLVVEESFALLSLREIFDFQH